MGSLRSKPIHRRQRYPFKLRRWAPSGRYAILTGTAVPSLTETEVVAGGQTIIITLTGDEWVAAGASFDAQRANIIQGLDSAQSETLGWNNQVRDVELVTAVVRTSSTVVTITLTAHILYNITAQETITMTIPSTAVISGAALVATPTFTADTTGRTTKNTRAFPLGEFVGMARRMNIAA